MERQPHNCCKNCESRDNSGFCENILEPLRQDLQFEGVAALLMPDNGYCTRYKDSDEFIEAEEAARIEMQGYPERQRQAPADDHAWGVNAAGAR